MYKFAYKGILLLPFQRSYIKERGKYKGSKAALGLNSEKDVRVKITVKNSQVEVENQRDDLGSKSSFILFTFLGKESKLYEM